MSSHHRFAHDLTGNLESLEWDDPGAVERSVERSWAQRPQPRAQPRQAVAPQAWLDDDAMATTLHEPLREAPPAPRPTPGRPRTATGLGRATAGAAASPTIAGSVAVPGTLAVAGKVLTETRPAPRLRTGMLLSYTLGLLAVSAVGFLAMTIYHQVATDPVVLRTTVPEVERSTSLDAVTALAAAPTAVVVEPAPATRPAELPPAHAWPAPAPVAVASGEGPLPPTALVVPPPAPATAGVPAAPSARRQSAGAIEPLTVRTTPAVPQRVRAASLQRRRASTPARRSGVTSRPKKSRGATPAGWVNPFE